MTTEQLMMRGIARGGVAGLLMLGLACSSSNNNSAPAGYNPGTITGAGNATSVYVNAICHLYLTCGFLNFPDEATCQNYFAVGVIPTNTFNSLPAFVEAVNAGKVALDNTKATACAATIANMSCPVLLPNKASLRELGCDTVVTTPLNEGDACISDDECDADSVCIQDSTIPNTSCLTGKCEKKGASTGFCRDNSDCAPGTFCLIVDGGPSSCGTWSFKVGDYGDKCTVATPPCQLATGGPTDAGVVDAGPIPDGGILDAGYVCGFYPCKQGLVCHADSESSTAGLCGAPSGNGGPCGLHGECGTGTVCTTGTNGKTVCKLLTPPPTKAGQECLTPMSTETSSMIPRCSPGLICVPADLSTGKDLCEEPLTVGASCAATYACSGPYGSTVCNLKGNKVCETAPTDGKACPSDGMAGQGCDFSTHCENEVCTANAKLGASCTESSGVCGVLATCPDGGMTANQCSAQPHTACAP